MFTRSISRACVSLICLTLCAVCSNARAQSFVYAVGNSAGNGLIYGFSVNEATGGLTALTTGFPVDTGGTFTGGTNPNHLCYDAVNRRLFALNVSGQSLAVFSVDTATGALTGMPYSPINLGVPNGNWVTVLVHPSGSPVLIGDAGAAGTGRVASYNLTATAATQAAGSPFAAGGTCRPLNSAFSQDGMFFYTGGSNANTPVAGFSVNASSGVLTSLAGSPYSTFGTGNAAALATDAAGHIFAANVGNTNLFSFTTVSGVPTAVTGNASASNTNPSHGVVHPSGYFMFCDKVSNSVGVYKASAGAVLSPVANFPSGGTTTNVLALNNTGTFLYALNSGSRNISTFSVTASTGALSTAVVQPVGTLGTNPLSGLVYVYQPTTVTSITPDFSTQGGVTNFPASGGTQTVIAGTNFVLGTTVTINGKNATVVSFTSTTLTVNVPTGAGIGYVDVVVSPPGNAAITKSQFFYYDDFPVAAAQTVTTLEDTAFNGSLVATHGANKLPVFKMITPPSKGTLRLAGATLSNKASTGSVATMTTTTPHGFTVGQSVSVACSPRDSNFDTANAVITSVPSPTTFTYSMAGTALPDSVTDGTVQAITFSPVKPVSSVLPFTYTPNADVNGTDTFTFSATDGLLDAVPVTVTITIVPVNDPPTISVASNTLTVPEEQPVTIQLTGIAPGPATATDENGQIVTLSVSVTPLVVSAITKSQDGNLTETLAITQPIAGTAQITFTPAFSSSFTVVVIVADNGSATAPNVNTRILTINVTVTPVNDAPVITNPGPKSGNTGTSGIIALTGIAPAPPNNPDEGGQAGGMTLAVSASDPAFFSLLSVSTLNSSNGTATISYVPAKTGTVMISVTVDDHQAANNTTTITFPLYVGSAPVAQNDVYLIPSGVAAPVIIAAGVGVLANDTSTDNNPLRAVLSTIASHGILSLNQDGSFTYQPQATFTGIDTFSYFAANPGYQSAAPATVTLYVSSQQPTISIFFESLSNPAFYDGVSAPGSFYFNALNSAMLPLSYKLDFGDGTPVMSNTINTVPAGNFVDHSYLAPGNFTVTLTVSDGISTVTQSFVQVVPMPSSGGAGVPNVTQGDPPVVTPTAVPMGGLGMSVTKSSGGVVQLFIDASKIAMSASDFRITTDFHDVDGVTTVLGANPVHQFTHRGVFVAESKAITNDTNTVVGHARKTLVLSAKETDDFPANVRVAVPGTPRAASSSTAITTKSLKGKFAFQGAASDKVSFTGTVTLPAGLMIGQPHEMWVGIGNIIVKTMVDGKGKAQVPGTPAILKSAKFTIKGKKGTISKGGETGTVAVTYSTAGMVANGFDTEGINPKASDVTGRNTAIRSIQLALLVDGIPFQAQAMVNFSKSADSEFGSISSRSGK